MRSWRLIGTVAAVLAIGVGAAWWTSAAADERAAGGASQRIPVAGVSNFARVNEHLFRGAQPEPGALAAVKSLGVDTVVKLDGEAQASERREADALGLRFVDLPWNAQHEPTHQQVLAFLALVHDHPDYHIFVHCRAGADRTGVMVAIYRMEIDHWTPARAISEMDLYHYHSLFLPHLERYVEAFPAAAATDPDLQRFDQPGAPVAP